MQKIIAAIAALMLFVVHTGNAQTYTVSGYVKDKATGESLIGAVVQVIATKAGTATNEYGFYSLTLEKGNHEISVKYVGYEPYKLMLELDASMQTDILLSQVDKTLTDVVVSSNKKDEKLAVAQMGMEKLNMKDIKNIPVLFGEKDILKTIQLLPGVKSAGDGNSGFYVRGGAADQNLILLDEAPVYNASHLLGFFSTFNADAIKDVTMYKGGMPAQYGGRLSSVLDIRMNEGNSKDYSVSGGVGLISSKLNIEGPIVKDKGSFLITGRRTYADLFLKLSNDSALNNNKLYFYDINAKANYKLGDKDRLYLSGYFGRDVLGVGDAFGIDWGNATGTLRWNHQLGNKAFSNTSLIYSNYDYNIGINTSASDINIKSRIEDWNLKQDFQFYGNSKHSVRAGLNSIYHTITPGVIEASGQSSINSISEQKRYAWENAVYVSDNWKLSDKLNVDAGLRISAFSVLGPGKYYELDEQQRITDTLNYSSGEFVKTYVNPEPRLGLAYRLSETSSIKAGYARNTQYLHLISNSTSSSPTDKWVPSNNIIKPEIADQLSLGYFHNFSDGKFELSAETYYKAMQNQIDYKDGADVFMQDAIETQLLFGKGRAYGLELMLKKSTGKFTGWISYTLSRTEKQINGINNGDWYVARQDRTHDLSVVAMYQLSKRWVVSGTWVYYTGNAVSFPSGKYEVDGNVVFYYTERNGYRMPAYHRLDLGATYQLSKPGRKFTSELSLGLYNAYGRENAYTITFRQSESDPSKTEAVQTSLFKWVPSISYNFKF